MDTIGTKSRSVNHHILKSKIISIYSFFSYSGADIVVVCREALLRPIRRLRTATHFKRVTNHLKGEGPRELWLRCSPGDREGVEMSLEQIKSDELCEPPVTMVSTDKYSF